MGQEIKTVKDFLDILKRRKRSIVIPTAAIFILADQPQIPTTILEALTERHAAGLAPILAPLVNGQRANPVLCDRVTFPALRGLTGDTGGRAIFGKFPVEYLPWHDERLLLDVDTPDDLDKLRNQE